MTILLKVENLDKQQDRGVRIVRNGQTLFDIWGDDPVKEREFHLWADGTIKLEEISRS